MLFHISLHILLSGNIDSYSEAIVFYIFHNFVSCCCQTRSAKHFFMIIVEVKALQSTACLQLGVRGKQRHDLCDNFLL